MYYFFFSDAFSFGSCVLNFHLMQDISSIVVLINFA